MYNKVSKEDFDRIFDEAVLALESKEKKYVIWGSAEMIEKIENAFAKELEDTLRLTDLETKIIELRKEGLTYHAIQLALGNPSKKFIKDTLKKYAPELAGDVVKNYGRLRKP